MSGTDGRISDSVDISKWSVLFEDARSSIESLSESYNGFIERVVGGTADFDDSVDMFSRFIKSAKSAAKEIEGITQQMADFLPPEVAAKTHQVVALMGDVAQASLGVIDTITQSSNTLSQLLDASTSYHRNSIEAVNESINAYGLNMEAIDEFRATIDGMSDTLGTYESGFMGVADAIKVQAAASDAGIRPNDKLAKTITTAAGDFEGLNFSFLQAKAMGLDLSRYMNLLSNALNTQGLSSQEAAEQMAMFQATSEETGFSVGKVATHLQGISDGFSLIGMTAEFGRPLLEGFTRTLNNMGLGFENALELSKSLADSLADLTSNYSSAYITFQRGGLDINSSGTALGAGIGLQQRMLMAKESGTQGELALELAEGMKATLESFSIGRIVTGEEATGSPELETIYYQQTQLLKSLYGINDNQQQMAILALLKDLDSTSADNVNIGEELARQMEGARDYQAESLSTQEKIAKATETALLKHDINNTFQAAMLAATDIDMNQFSDDFVAGISDLIKGTANVNPSDILNKIKEFVGESEDDETGGGGGGGAPTTGLTDAELNEALENGTLEDLKEIVKDQTRQINGLRESMLLLAQGRPPQ